jgi:hypothetical protein
MYSDNKPPVADAGVSYKGFTNETIYFYGYKSDDIDGLILNYTWDFGDEHIEYGKYLSHKYNSAGEYIVTLTVKDDAGATDTDTTNCIVTDKEEDEKDPLDEDNNNENDNNNQKNNNNIRDETNENKLGIGIISFFGLILLLFLSVAIVLWVIKRK